MTGKQPFRGRKYFSRRQSGTGPEDRLTLDQAKTLFINEYVMLWREDYFQEAFGYQCVDAGKVYGTVADPEAFFLKHLRRSDLWPVENLKYPHYSEEDLFDVIELIHDLVSKPLEGRYHAYGECGMHYETFDCEAGRSEYRERVNGFLRDYGEGWEVSSPGEILLVGIAGTADLLNGPPAFATTPNVGDRVARAILKFRRYGATPEDKHDAVKDLVDALEFIRPTVKDLLTSKDEADLFNIANNFAIRHNTPDQKAAYDKETWSEWMFYYYLATLRACEQLAARVKPPSLDP